MTVYAKWLVCGFGICASMSLYAQKIEVASINLTVQQGLASNQVYCALQDDQGHIWFGTETGVSRYNGREFENFYMSDGLADNEIFRMDQDNQGRIWFSALNGKLSYYQDGKFVNAQTDASLGKIEPETFYLNFLEDSYGNLFLTTKREVIVISDSGEVREFKNNLSSYRRVSNFVEEQDTVWGISPNSNRLIAFSISDQISDKFIAKEVKNFDATLKVYLGQDKVHLYGNAVHEENEYLRRTHPYLAFSKKQISKIHNYGDGYSWFCTYKGVLRTKEGSITGEEYFPNDIVTHVLKDRDGGHWFTTLGAGIKYVPTLLNKTIELDGDQSNNYVSALLKDEETIWFGGAQGLLGQMKAGEVSMNFLFNTELRSMVKRIVKGSRRGEYWIAAENRLVQIRGTKSIVSALTSAKVISSWGQDTFALGLNGYIMILTRDQLNLHMETAKNEIKQSFEMQADLSLHFEKNVGFVFDIENYKKGLLISTSLGVFYMDRDFNFSLMPGPDVMTRRVNDILVLSELEYALATHGHGVYLFKNGDWTHFTKKNGLNSDICRKVIKDQTGAFWIATNKGVNQVKITDDGFDLESLTKADGLMSEEVHDLVVQGDSLVVATSEGISIINISDWERGKTAPVMAHTVLKVNENMITEPEPEIDRNAQNITFEYGGLHYRSLDRMAYEYRLVGLDDEWRSTSSDFINIETLGPGKYDFQVRAVSAFGHKSEISNHGFLVVRPFWEKWWFMLLLLLIFLAGVLVIVQFIIRKNKLKTQRKFELQLRISEAERKALQSQLNPHFIFNSLNSVQSMVLTNNPNEAYDFLEKFSKLIRRVLEFSDLSMISLEDELSTLRLYMELENLRLNDKFDYSINVSELESLNQYIPSMIIQPYVENAIWHGIIPLEKGRRGEISISISGKGDELFIEVLDNGVGRQVGEKSGRMGTKIANELVKNLSNDRVGKVKIEDLSEGGRPTGTKVTLHIQKKEKEYDKSFSY